MPTRSSTKTKTPTTTRAKKAPAKRAATKKAPAKKRTKKTTTKTAATKETTSTTSKAATAAALKTAAELAREQAKASTHTIVVKRQPLGHLLFEKKLRAAGFTGVVTTKQELLNEYATDESIFSIQPQVVIQPKNQADVEVAVRVVATETKRFESLSLTPRAAGTGLSGGSLTDSIVIDVSRFLTNIGKVETKRGETTITCEPGAMWHDVEKVLKKHDRYLPPYPASKDICSIGGSIANNAAGPDSLRFGHCANWVAALKVTLADGETYTVRPMKYHELQTLLKRDNAYATLARTVFTQLKQHEAAIQAARPHASKNTAGYALWDVLSVPLAQFTENHGTFDLTRIFSGSQGSIGIITEVTLKTEPIAHDTVSIVVPVFDLMDASRVITKALELGPINIELFDALTYDLALRNPDFFKDRLGPIEYYKVMFKMYTLYHVRYARKIPEFTILITVRADEMKMGLNRALAALSRNRGKYARILSNKAELEMFWQIRRASYSLSKFQDTTKRPAAFLEDMVVPPEKLSRFFTAIKKLFRKYNVSAAVHGHGGNGHLHFYPLLDFTNKTTPALILKMADEFYETALQFDGNLCGEHNDGIIRTPELNQQFSPTIVELFRKLEHAADPDDIFNPGKKVNPRFDVKESIRHTN